MRKADYSKLASEYDSSRLSMDPRGNVWLKALLDRIDARPDDWVLEAGCGTGRWTLALSECFPMVGMDPSPAMLEEATKKPGSGNVLWVRGGAPEAPFREGVFGAVVYILVLQHVPEIERTLADAYRVLKPGGRVVIRTCGHDYIRGYPLGRVFPGYREVELATFPEVEWLKETMGKVGFRDVESAPVSQEVTYPAEEYLRKVRNRFISTLYRIGEESFQEGYRRLEEELRGRESFTYRIEHEFVVGRRQDGRIGRG